MYLRKSVKFIGVWLCKQYYMLKMNCPYRPKIQSWSYDLKCEHSIIFMAMVLGLYPILPPVHLPTFHLTRPFQKKGQDNEKWVGEVFMAKREGGGATGRRVRGGG